MAVNREIGSLVQNHHPEWKRRIVLSSVVGLIFMACFILLWKVNRDYAIQMPGGNDFLVHWMGAKALLKGQDPYGDQTALEIQHFAYGRAAKPGEHELRVAYPLYAEFFFIPFALIEEFPVARSLWMTLLELLTIASASLMWTFTTKENSKFLFFLFLLFSFGWYFGIRALINGNAVVLVGFFLILALWSQRRNNAWLFGIFLACTTIKPQVALVPVACIFLWLIVSHRWRAFLSFVTSMGFFIGISILVMPDWIARNWREVLRYPDYNPPGTPATAMAAIWGSTGEILGWGISVIAILILLWKLWQLVGGKKQFPLEIFCWAIILSPMIGMQTDAGNEWIFLLPIAWLMGANENQTKRFLIRSILLQLFIFFGLWSLFLLTLQPGLQPQQHPLMLFPLPFFLILIALWESWRQRNKQKQAMREPVDYA